MLVLAWGVLCLVCDDVFNPRVPCDGIGCKESQLCVYGLRIYSDYQTGAC